MPTEPSPPAARRKPAARKTTPKTKNTAKGKERGAAPSPIGRPPEFDQDIADQICSRLALGETLRKICDDIGIPSVATVLTWQREKPRFLLQYHRARVEQTRTWADEIITLADDNANDFKKVTRKSGQTDLVVDREAIERTKLRIWTRQWLMGKVNRTEFGEGTGDPVTGTPALADANPQELVVQLVHLLSQFQIKLTPEQVEQVKISVSRGEDDPDILVR